MGFRNDEALVSCIRQLEHALTQNCTGRERDWAEEFSSALNCVEDVLRQHVHAAEGPEGFLADVDLTHAMTSTISRGVEALRRQNFNLLEQAAGLQVQVQKAAQAFPYPISTGGPAGFNPSASTDGRRPDLAGLRLAGQKLFSDLQRHKAQETNLLMESVAADVGAGD